MVERRAEGPQAHTSSREAVWAVVRVVQVVAGIGLEHEAVAKGRRGHCQEVEGQQEEGCLHFGCGMADRTAVSPGALRFKHAGADKWSSIALPCCEDCLDKAAMCTR